MRDNSLSGGGRISPFDAIRHVDEQGEYWSARELAKLLEYSRWQKFLPVIEKAEEACNNSNQATDDHFHHAVQKVSLGSGAQRTIEDYQLSRYACYLIVQNSDPSKDAVALGQTYFATRTRRDELAQEREEMRLRVEEREKLKRYHRELFKAAGEAGVVTAEDFAVFEDHGYLGLYNETAQQISERKGLKPRQNISDFMGSTETAANGFRAALAREMLKGEGVQEKGEANRTHHRSGRIVRQAIQEAGVAPPEQLPTPEHSIQQVRRELARQRRIEDEDRLGLFGPLLETGEDTSSN